MATGAVDESKNNGQIARVEGFVGAQKQWQQRFEYDSLGRLSSAGESRGDTGQQSYLLSYDYDAYGNRYQKQQRNPGNPFAQSWVEDGAFSPATNRFAAGLTYDDAGNVLADSRFRERARTQNRIKAELRFYGRRLPEITGRWSKPYVENLRRIRSSTRRQQESFESLLEQYEFFTQQIERQTGLLRSLSQTAEYRERVQILQSIPGVGLIAAMELLLELQDVTWFRRADQLAAYVGLTPARHSSGDVVRTGRITRSGKDSLRGTLAEAARRMVSRDGAVRQQYEQLKAWAGAKRAIAAVARRLLLRARRMLLDKRAHVAELVAA